MTKRAPIPIAAVIALSAGLMQPGQLRAQQWEIVQPQRSEDRGTVPSQTAGTLQWTVVPTNQVAEAEGATDDSAAASSPELGWQPLTGAELDQQKQAIEAEIQQAQERINNPTIVLPPSGPTYANLRALWRDGDWLPQISNTVPVGFGPQGVMATFSYRSAECIAGGAACTVPDAVQNWQDSVQSQSDTRFSEAIGFGDALNSIGVIVTNTTQQKSISGPRGQDQLVSGTQTGFHVSKAFGPDTALRIGVENLIHWDSSQASLPKSAYGVFSQRLRLGPDDGGWFRNIYLTVGAGNGAFRPLDQQIDALIAAQRSAGCFTLNYIPPSRKDCSPQARRRAEQDADDFGNLAPLGAIGIEVVRGLNLIGEWSGSDLNLGLSVRPFPEIGLVITPMFENVIATNYYNVNMDVPAALLKDIPINTLSLQPRFSIQASVELKF